VKKRGIKNRGLRIRPTIGKLGIIIDQKAAIKPAKTDCKVGES
jgi:hypothetical protein